MTRPVRLSVDRLVGRSFIISLKSGKFHFRAPIGGLVTSNLVADIIGKSGYVSDAIIVIHCLFVVDDVMSDVTVVVAFVTYGLVVANV